MPTKSTRKSKATPQDGGLDANARARLRSAIREVWHWTSYARKLCLKRAVGEDGFPRCELCREMVPKVFADHKTPCGKFDAGFIDRLFVSSKELQALCKKCHDRKTRAEKKALASPV